MFVLPLFIFNDIHLFNTLRQIYGAENSGIIWFTNVQMSIISIFHKFIKGHYGLYIANNNGPKQHPCGTPKIFAYTFSTLAECLCLFDVFNQFISYLKTQQGFPDD